MISGYFSLAIKSIRSRKLRSWLTIAGIIIGIAAIVSLITVSQGLENSINEQFDKLGGNRAYVMAKGDGMPGSTQGLTTEDVRTLEKYSELKYVNPYVFEISRIGLGKKENMLNVLGFPADDAEKRLEGMGLDLEKGRYFKPGEKYACILGHLVAHDAFDREVIIGSNLKINDVKFKVIGVFDEIGNPEDDSQVYIPYETANDFFDLDDNVAMIEVVFKQGVDIDNTIDKMKRGLERKRGDDNFDMQTPEQLKQQFSSILMIVQIVIIGIAAISLIVGAIGIMNSMYTSVLERIDEIGIMKSIGARNSDILLIFLVEAGIIGLIGGVIGSILGTLLSLGIGTGAEQGGFSMLKVTIEPSIVIFGIVFALVVGMAAGALPARQASKMKPVDALRYGQ